MIKRIYFVLILLFFCGCHGQKRNEKDTNQAVDTVSSSKISNAEKSNFYSILGIDSVAQADYVFIDFTIDSIAISSRAFEAIYLYCFKGSIHKENYKILETLNPTEYNEIVKIHTSHLLNAYGKEFSFNAKGNIGCWENIPESTIVDVEAKVYSLFSSKKSIGKFIILESIKKKT